MAHTIRRIARALVTVANFCTNPLCLHATPARGCACCRSHR